MNQYNKMKRYCDGNDDMPDGAFFAMAEEMHGWTVDDWVWYSEEYKKHEKVTA